MKSIFRMLQHLCTKAALSISLLLFALLCAAGLFVTAHLGKQSWSHESVVFTSDSVFINLCLMLLTLCAIVLIYHLLQHLPGVKLGIVMLGAWCLCTLVLVASANIVQMYDFAYIVEGAELFAQGNYKPMTLDYFHAYSYQLGICLPMEIVKRALPALDLSLFMQLLNILLSAGIAGILTAISSLLFSSREARASLLLFVLFLPLALQCIFTYSTLPMLLLASASMLCLTLYLQRRNLRYGLAYAILIALSFMLKPNAAIPLIAASLCALVDLLTSRDVKLFACIALGVLLSFALQRLVILQYEWRADITLTGDVSMLARLVMGLQRGGAEAGWFNRYTEQFFPLDVTPVQEYAIASADLSARLAEMKADPAMTFAFFRDKMLSQWLEPSYGAMWYGDLCRHAGLFADITHTIFTDGGSVRCALERCMGVYQKLLYFLICTGLVSELRKKHIHCAALLLPVCALGGFLYHMVFEAKAQYMYPYVLLMIPFAAHGVCLIHVKASALIRSIRRRSSSARASGCTISPEPLRDTSRR